MLWFTSILISASAVSFVHSAGPLCPFSDLERFLIPHESDCGLYYACERGVPIPQRCPDGLHFSTSVKQCVLGYNSDCNAIIQADQDLEDSAEPKNDDVRKILRCKESSLWPHKDCSQYNICANGKLVAMPCPEGLQWNLIVKRCVWPQLSTCWRKKSYAGIQQFDTQMNEINDVSIDSDVPLDDALGGIHYDLAEDEIPQEDPQKILRCKESSLWPHRDCSQYNICANGKLVAMPCPEGLQWNFIVKRCVWPRLSTCWRKKSYDGIQQFETQMDEINDVSIDSDVPLDDALIGINYGLTEDEMPQEDAQKILRCKESSLWPHRDCSQYNICANGKLVAMPCPEGLQWNFIVKRCVWPRLSTCWRKKSYDGVQDFDTHLEALDDVLVENDIPLDDAPEVEIPQEDAQKILRCKESSLWPHRDCSQYNICANGKLVAMPCPEGLLWNARRKICDWPKSAKCFRLWSAFE